MNFPNSRQILWPGKRFNSFNRVLKDRFYSRVDKIGLRLDFTCPNRDGKVAVGGCIKNTVLEKFYKQGQVRLFSRAGYVDLAIDFLEFLNPGIVAHRLSDEAHRSLTGAPHGSIDKRGSHHAIFTALERRDSWQGRSYPALAAAAAVPLTFDCLQGATL